MKEQALLEMLQRNDLERDQLVTVDMFVRVFATEQETPMFKWISQIRQQTGLTNLFVPPAEEQANQQEKKESLPLQ